MPSDRHKHRRKLDMLNVSAAFRGIISAAKYAAHEENFVAVAGVAVTVILVGTAVYSLGEGWNVVDGLYFAVSTLATAGPADPNLTLTHDALKLFTVFYLVTGIGILVELARELGVGFVKAREARDAKEHKEDPPETHSAG